MSGPAPVRLMSVKLSPIGRVHPFLVERLPEETSLRPGDQVVVQTETGPAVGTVVPSITALEDKRRLPAGSPQQVVRLATRDDIVTRLKHQQREREAHNVATLKIRER